MNEEKLYKVCWIRKNEEKLHKICWIRKNGENYKSLLD
jgi:hypothetical protein